MSKRATPFIIQRDLAGRIKGVYLTQTVASKKTKVPLPSINNCCKGYTLTAYGSRWEYTTPLEYKAETGEELTLDKLIWK